MQLNLQDQMLKVYIDRIFDKYDTDKSGTLDQQQLTYFFNDLFKQLGMGVTVSSQQTLQAIRSIDQNSDGGVDKKQLFDAFKILMNKPQQPPQVPMNNSYPPNQYPPQYNPYQPVQHNPYGMYNPYTQQPPYNPYQQPQYNPYMQGQYNNNPNMNYGYQNTPYNGYNQGGMGNSLGGGSGWGRRQ